ncbi:hypothetical protein H4R19_001170 [Coemansia spiralis]|nr:hypothetical protein H4R19_001170 [Coemansia spiralis]
MATPNKQPARWRPGERVCSLEELYRAADIRLSRKVPITKYFQDLEATLSKAKTRLMDQDLQYAYVYYMRYVKVAIKHLPNQPGYNDSEHAKSRERVEANAKKALTALERLQPILQQRHEEYVHYLATLPRPKAAVSTYSTRRAAVGPRADSTPHRTASQRRPPKAADRHRESDHLKDAPDRYQTSASASEQSLASAMQGLDIARRTSNQNSSGGARGATYALPMPVRGVPVAYPPVAPAHRTPSAPVWDGSGEMPVAPYPVPSLPLRTPPGRPDYAVIPPHSAQSLFAPGYGPAPGSTQPMVPPKPQEYHDSTPKCALAAAPRPADASSFMPPCLVDAAHHALTEGGVRLQTIQLPEGIFEEFMDIAHANTQANLETCAVLCGKQVPGQQTLVMTTLILPKQRATSDTCTTEREEELFAEQMDRDLITLGWIHTHPSQTCFMSSLDLHTQCSYQLMLPEAIAIVCAPRHEPRFGIFRLTDPPGIDLIQNCKEQSAFHPHDTSKEIYTNASDGGHVVLANYDFDIVDIRGQS